MSISPSAPDWRRLALDPPRAVDPVAGRARLRVSPEDFVVDEELGFAASGEGAHFLLRVRKRGANTGWVARELARCAGVRPFDVGYAGLKDRNAVTTQWFSVPRARRSSEEWLATSGEGWQVLEAHGHTRKLPRGALAGNRFRIVLRDFLGDRAALETRLARIVREGVPNYFGPQRFGRELSNLSILEGRAPPRGEESFAWSAARSLVFNAVLARRIHDGSWNRLSIGERANLDGRNSTFLVESLDDEIAHRVATFDIHPTGPLIGNGDSGVSGALADLEREVAAEFPLLVEFLQSAGLEAARRPLRVAVRELEWQWLADDVCALQFALRAGSFATAVVRELLALDGAAAHEEQG